jgi:hypothetical protein
MRPYHTLCFGSVFMPIPNRTCSALVAALFLCALCAVGSPSRADDPPAPASDAVEKIISPLREIGRVRARSAYCIALVRDGAAAAQSAVNYEVARVTAFADLRDVLFANEFQKMHAVHVLELDLARMVDLARQGRTELNGLRTTASEADAEKASAVLAFRDALDGAKAHQLEQTRDLARILGDVEGQLGIRALADKRDPGTDDATALHRLQNTSPELFLEPFESDLSHSGSGGGPFGGDINKAIFQIELVDPIIKSDMVRAGEESTRALALGNCSK